MGGVDFRETDGVGQDDENADRAQPFRPAIHVE